MDYITHYYSIGTTPLLNISTLPFDEALKVANNLKNLPGKVYKRFHNAELYLRERQITEKWLKEEFIKLGGVPKCNVPGYFVLGESTHLEEAFAGKYAVIRIPLDEIDENEISFTYPDSMATRFIANEKDAVYYNPEYHGKVFTKKSITEVIKKWGLPEEQWRYDPKKKYDYFIEVQLWNDAYLKKYQER